MNQKIFYYSLISIFLFASCSKQAVIKELILDDSWYICSSEQAKTTGEMLSSGDGFAGDYWIKATVPSTVMGALTKVGIYEDAFYAMNLKDIPTEQFRVPWWYCTSFDLPSFDVRKEQTMLLLDGINYRANIWLNGQMILSADTAFGAFRQFTCDITTAAKAHGNKLAIEVIPPKAGDFYMGFVDWAPVPPDNNMGIYRQVRIKRSAKVSLSRPFITTDVDIQTLKEASLTITTGITNHASEQKKVTLEATIENITVKEDWTLEAGQTITAKLHPDKYKELIVKNPRLWWPNGLGNPEMYTLKIALKDGQTLLDSTSVRFGIRTIDTYMNDQDVRGYKVNGREVLIKSAGWVDDLFLRDNTRSNKTQIRYVKEMNLNSIRFEGFWGTSQEIYDLCDENGILLMVGWSCQWEWPDYLGLELEVPEEDQNIPINEGVDMYGVKLTPEEEVLFSDMFRDQVIWLRNHPSIFVWAVGSDAMPKPSLEKRYMKTLEEYDMSRSLLVSAGEFISELSGKTGMKMNGPYEFVPPVYWFEDKKLGGAFGFNTETGPGPQIPPIQSIKKMIPEESLWPPLNEMWDYHSGRKDFNSVKVYLNALNKRYGEPQNLEELAMKAQWLNYESIRPMFEAFVVNRPVATGVVQWQLNSAWPEFYWQLYDWYFMPTGAYFGTMNSCQPINILYNYHDRKIYAANDVLGDLNGITAHINLYDSKSNLIYEYKEKITVKENTSLPVVELPTLKDQSETYFLKLELTNNNHKPLADNFYWLSGQEDVMDWDTYYWFYSPQKKFANFKRLNNLPEAQVSASKKIRKENGEWVIDVSLSNTSKNIAFSIEMMLVNADTEEPILPVFWDDNYVSLVNDDNKTITVRCSEEDSSGEPAVIIQGININKIKK